MILQLKIVTVLAVLLRLSLRLLRHTALPEFPPERTHPYTILPSLVHPITIPALHLRLFQIILNFVCLHLLNQNRKIFNGKTPILTITTVSFPFPTKSFKIGISALICTFSDSRGMVQPNPLMLAPPWTLACSPSHLTIPLEVSLTSQQGIYTSRWVLSLKLRLGEPTFLALTGLATTS